MTEMEIVDMKLNTPGVAKLFGVSTETVHHWRRMGIIKPCSFAKHRYWYDENEITKLNVLAKRPKGMSWQLANKYYEKGEL